MDILYGLGKGKSVLLSNIARALEEPIETIQTVKRLSNRLDEFHEEDKLVTNYKESIKPFLQEKDNLILVDTSEIVKPAASKMEALGRVRDGSTGKIENGYWTTSMIAVGPKTKHPISVYSHLYSSCEQGFISENEETYKGFRYVDKLLAEKKATFVMDRGYDNIEVMKRVLGQGDNFIIRLKSVFKKPSRKTKNKNAPLAKYGKMEVSKQSKIPICEVHFHGITIRTNSFPLL